MTVNERIRYFRKDVLHLNQRQFASDLGMAQTGVSGMERDGATVTDRAIRSICLAYGASEEWLRYGTGPIYEQQPTFSLDRFVKEHGATNLELEILKAYFELDPEIRKVVFDHFKARLSHAVGSVTEKPPLAMAARGGKVAPPQEPIDEDEFEEAMRSIEPTKSL